MSRFLAFKTEKNTHFNTESWLEQNKPEIYWNMLQTAEMVAQRYNVDREQQDHYGVQSQNRAAKAQQEGLFSDEIVKIETNMKVTVPETGKMEIKKIVAEQDEEFDLTQPMRGSLV